MKPSASSSPTSIRRVFRSARATTSGLSSAAVPQLVLREHVELLLARRVVLEDRGHAIDQAAVAVVDVAARRVDACREDLRMRQLEADCAPVVRDVHRVTLEPGEVDAGLDVADRDEQHTLAANRRRDEARVLLEVDDHLVVPRRRLEAAQILDRLQDDRAAAVDRLGAERVAERREATAESAERDPEREHEERRAREQARQVGARPGRVRWRRFGQASRSPAPTGSPASTGKGGSPLRPAASRSSAALSTRSHEKSWSSRPKCP